MKKTHAAAVTLFLLTALVSCNPPTSPLDSTKAIQSFSFTTPASTGVIDEPSGTIKLIVPDGTDRSSLVPGIQFQGTKISPASGVPCNFNAPVDFTVTAEDSSQKTYRVSVFLQNQTLKNLLSFSLVYNSTSAVVQLQDAQSKARVLVPQGVSLAGAVATFTTNAASVKIGTTIQVSGVTAHDFSNGVSYTLTAQDGSQKSFQIEVIRAGFCNDTGNPEEMNYVGTQFPTSISNSPGSSLMIYGRVNVPGLTEAAGASSQILAQFGTQPTGDHYLDNTWTWVNASWWTQVGSEDEYNVYYTLPAEKGTYRYGFRFSKDGGTTWTLSDKDGAGTGAFNLSEAQIALMTVN